jgi:hypothetical protein
MPTQPATNSRSDLTELSRSWPAAAPVPKWNKMVALPRRTNARARQSGIFSTTDARRCTPIQLLICVHLWSIFLAVRPSAQMWGSIFMAGCLPIPFVARVRTAARGRPHRHRINRLASRAKNRLRKESPLAADPVVFRRSGSARRTPARYTGFPGR